MNNTETIIPNHIAIIMDGNGRWATSRNLKRTEGHYEGSRTLEKIVLHACKIKLPYLSVYAFSTDNFKRSDEEVNYLMKLFVDVFTKKRKMYMQNNIKIVFSGRKEPLNDKVLKAMQKMMDDTKNNSGLVFNICLNYGGQEEIVDAIKKIVTNNVDVNSLTKEDINHYLYQDLPNIDLLIRTSGEYRISNFMIYTSAYSEYYFTDTYFPDFKEKELDEAILVFNKRSRRFGGYNEKKSH